MDLLLVPVDPRSDQRARYHEQVVALILNDILRAEEITRTADGYRINFPVKTSLGGGTTVIQRVGESTSWLTSEGPPDDAEGVLGDFCFDVAFSAIYQKQQAAPFVPPRWELLAEVGSPGPRGKDGLSITGPPGPVGPAGPAREVQGAEITRSTNQLINHATDTILTFPTLLEADSTAFYTGGTPWSRLICPTAGRYLITATVRWAVNNTGNRFLHFLVNGAFTTPALTISGNATTVGDVGLNCSKSRVFAAGDYIEVDVYQDSGVNINATEGTFSIARL